MQSSAMAVPKKLQLYLSWSQIFGDTATPSDVRVGENWYFMKERGLRLNGGVHAREQESRSATRRIRIRSARNGNVFHINLEMNF